MDCLRLYSFEHRYTDLIKRLGKQRIGPLTETLAYLKPSYLRPSLSDYTKEGIIKNLISRIESLFPDTCLICNKEYRIQLDDPPILPCEKCGQESHLECLKAIIGNPEELTMDSVKTLVNPFNLPGWSYNCLHCRKELIPSPDADVKTSVLNQEKKQSKNQRTQSSSSTLQIPADIDQTDQIAANPPVEELQITVPPAALNEEATENQADSAEPPEPERERTNSQNYPPSHPRSLKASCTKAKSCRADHPKIPYPSE